MRIEELSIGDWVTYDKCSDPVQILGMDSRNGKCVVMTDSCYSGGVIGFIDNVHPIPLTPEILEKNGCLHTAENRILCDWFDGRITVRKYNSREWYELFVGSNQMKFKLMFVHQLQHALRLAGIEKEIEV